MIITKNQKPETTALPRIGIIDSLQKSGAHSANIGKNHKKNMALLYEYRYIFPQHIDKIFDYIGK